MAEPESPEKEVLDDGYPKIGFVRLHDIIGPRICVIPVSNSTWWEGVRTGRFPKPVKIGPRISAWKVQDIRRLIREISNFQNQG